MIDSKTRHKVSDLKMKAQLFVAMILAIVSVARINAARLCGKGNMRGLATKFSGFSPRQMMAIKRLLNQCQNKKFGRFA